MKLSASSMRTVPATPSIDARVGVPWLGHACGVCPYCVLQRENLCNDPALTGYTRDGGFATHVVADRRALSRATASSAGRFAAIGAEVDAFLCAQPSARQRSQS